MNQNLESLTERNRLIFPHSLYLLLTEHIFYYRNSDIISNDWILQAGRMKMETLEFIYYHENGMWVGWLEEYPDYRSQGTSPDELKENFKDIYEDLRN